MPRVRSVLHPAERCCGPQKVRSSIRAPGWPSSTTGDATAPVITSFGHNRFRWYYCDVTPRPIPARIVQPHASPPSCFSIHPLCRYEISIAGLLSSGRFLSWSIWTRKVNAASDEKTYSRRAEGVRKSREGCAIFVQAENANRFLLFLIGEKDNNLSPFPLAPSARRLWPVFITGSNPARQIDHERHLRCPTTKNPPRK